MIDKKRIVGLIPARLGSERVRCKNLRLLAGKPLIYYAIRALQKSVSFDWICVNSESDQIGAVAMRYGIDFYKRPAKLASSDSLIDEYIYEFLKNTPCDVLAVVNPTSPFLSAQEIDRAMEGFLASDCDTMLSCEAIRTHCFLEGEAINFSTRGQHPRSQDIEPIKALNFAITIWNAPAFRAQFERVGHAVYTGNLDFFIVEGLASIDIDWDQDFALAEMLMENREKLETTQPKYDPVLSQYPNTAL